MSNIRSIRERLKLTQSALAQGIGCTQGNVWQYEQGMTVPPDKAKRLIEFAAKRGVALTYDDVYGRLSSSEGGVRTPAYTGPERRKARA